VKNITDHYRITAVDHDMQSQLGKLLISHPNFPQQSPFNKSLIYIYQDDSINGTVGVVLNKASRTSVSMLCEQNEIMFGDTQPMMYMGGPVNTSALLILHTDEWASSNTANAGGRLRISSDNHMFLKLSQGNLPIYWRAFFGFASWTPGQLQNEMNSSMWLTADSDEHTIFNYSGDKQWNKALELCSQQTIDYFF
jgi:putative transcriptional regulator